MKLFRRKKKQEERRPQHRPLDLDTLLDETVYTSPQKDDQTTASSTLAGLRFLDESRGQSTVVSRLLGEDLVNSVDSSYVRLPPTMNAPVVVTPEKDDATTVAPLLVGIGNLSDRALMQADSPGALRLTTDGLKRHERKTLLKDREPEDPLWKLKHEQERHRYYLKQQQQATTTSSKPKASWRTSGSLADQVLQEQRDKERLEKEKQAFLERQRKLEGLHKNSMTIQEKSSRHSVSKKKPVAIVSPPQVAFPELSFIHEASEDEDILSSPYCIKWCGGDDSTVATTGAQSLTASKKAVRLLKEPRQEEKKSHSLSLSVSHEEQPSYLDFDKWCQARPSDDASTSDISTVNDVGTVTSGDIATLASRSEMELCITCRRTSRTHVAYPCRHYNFCEACAQNYTFCPVCQRAGVSFIAYKDL